MNNESKIKTRCPGCKKKTAWEGNQWRPFCSERCKTLDLGAWASEDYSIQSQSEEYEESLPDINNKEGGYN